MARPSALTVEQEQDAVRRYADRESPETIGASFGISASNVIYYARKAGVPRRGIHRSIATCRHCGVDFWYETANCKRAPRLFCGNECRKIGYRGAIHGNFLAKKAVYANGYRFVEVPAGHVTRSLSGDNKNRAPEHVIIVERALGRPLRSGEVVHHINADRSDNRRANLLVCDRHYHSELHARMSYLYQREHFGEELA